MAGPFWREGPIATKRETWRPSTSHGRSAFLEGPECQAVGLQSAKRRVTGMEVPVPLAGASESPSFRKPWNLIGFVIMVSGYIP